MFVGTRKLRSSGADRSIKLSEEGTERGGAEFVCLQGRGSCGAAEWTVRVCRGGEKAT